MSPIKKKPLKSKTKSREVSDTQLDAIRKILKIHKESDVVIVFKTDENGQQVTLSKTSNLWVAAASLSIMKALGNS